MSGLQMSWNAHGGGSAEMPKAMRWRKMIISFEYLKNLRQRIREVREKKKKNGDAWKAKMSWNALPKKKTKRPYPDCIGSHTVFRENICEINCTKLIRVGNLKVYLPHVALVLDKNESKGIWLSKVQRDNQGLSVAFKNRGKP